MGGFGFVTYDCEPGVTCECEPGVNCEGNYFNINVMIFIGHAACSNIL